MTDDHPPSQAGEAWLRCGPLGDQDLNRALALHEPATFCFRMTGNAMRGAGILHGDIAVCQRCLLPSPGDLVIVQSTDGFLLRRWSEHPELRLLAASPDCPDLTADDLQGWQLIGVITGVIRTYSRSRESDAGGSEPHAD